MGKSTVDQRGRITLPQRERKRVGLRPGDRVHVQATDQEVTIRKTVSPREFAKIFAGCISEENAVGEPVDPLRIKEMWRLAGG
ncbi:MAG: AbrB/MazE/SpoVT family DNA-binding domain-containing protein [Candidatus Thermoplasmatota archaeon]|nr:AbrB/MazE/SpoVT family DNA-binding domain-containing protein [Candidatus Thermoplasmatota archaeon]